MKPNPAHIGMIFNKTIDVLLRDCYEDSQSRSWKPELREEDCKQFHQLFRTLWILHQDASEWANTIDEELAQLGRKDVQEVTK